MCRQHGMDGMSEFVRQGCHVSSPPRVTHQDVRCILRVDRSAEGPTLLALTGFAIKVVLIEDALSQFANFWLKSTE